MEYQDYRDAGIWFMGITEMPPIAATFFTGTLARNFVEVLKSLLKHQDTPVSEGIAQCMFEENFNTVEYQIDPTEVYNQPFKGVRFSYRISWFDPLEYEIVDVPTFMSYVREVCEKFLQQYPQYKEEVEKVFRSNGLIY